MATSETPQGLSPPSATTAPTGTTAIPPTEWMVDGTRLNGANPPPKRIALFVVHGMGQQSHLDTISGACDGLRAALHATPQQSGPASELAIVLPGKAQAAFVGDQRYEFLSFDLRRINEDQVRAQLHVYEGYWAPLTEGVVKLSDVMKFLQNGALGALIRIRFQFTRFIYDKLETFRVPFWSTLHLLIAFAVVMSLVILNASVVFVQSKRLMAAAPQGAVIDGLTRVLGVTLLLMAAFALTMFAAIKRWGGSVVRGFLFALFPLVVVTLVLSSFHAGLILYAGDRCNVPPIVASSGAVPGAAQAAAQQIPGPVNYCTSALRRAMNEALGITAFVKALLVAAALFALAILLEGVARLIPLARSPQEVRRTRSYHATRGLTLVCALVIVVGLVYTIWLGRGIRDVAHYTPDVAGPPVPVWWLAAVWAGLIVLSITIRGVLVQYVGDVVVYVASHSLDRFFQTRALIRDRVYQALRSLYAMQVEGKPVYDEVIVIGHSLGSLVAYDTLDRLISEDEAARASPARFLKVVARTPLFLTFGSPMDKTAFIFAQQVTEETRTRAALASTAQPMLMNPLLRPTRWVNVWSPWDIISGPLEFYDPATKGADVDPGERHRIENKTDLRANTLLYAHVEYWKNSVIYDEVLKEVGRFVAS